MRKKVLIVGGNMAGLVVALSVKHDLDGDVDVRVVSTADRFVFTPSLIRLAFGQRQVSDITFPLLPTFDEHGVDFVHTTATRIDAASRKVETTSGTYDYDHLVVATGSRPRLDAVPGLTETRGVHTITTLSDAVAASEGWRRFLFNPGPVIVAATQGASCFGAAYEYLFAMAHQLRIAGLHARVPLTYVTTEPFLGHLGTGGLPGAADLLGMLVEREGMTTITSAEVDEITPGRLALTDGTALGFSYAVVIPPFEGQDVARTVDGLSDQNGYVVVQDTFRSVADPAIYAVGAAAAAPLPWISAVAVAMPSTGLPTDLQARTAAAAIASHLRDGEVTTHTTHSAGPAMWVLDTGKTGVAVFADSLLPPGSAAALIPGPHANGARRLFERYFLWKASSGYVSLP